MDIVIKFFVSLLIASGLIFIFNSSKSLFDHKDIESLNLKGVNKLMIVAHPDDETIWGGSRLIEDDYLVVCITCGNNKIRSKELKKAMQISNNPYIMLGYPDTVKGVRSDWKKEYDQIKKDLRKIINYKNWDLIVTHNPEGEYGHEHHKMTNEIVTELCSDKDKLYYFGKYYRPSIMKRVKNNLKKIDSKVLETKLEMIKVYKSQSFIAERFGHMFEYENWIKATEWNDFVV